jgi:hypothetical protein
LEKNNPDFDFEEMTFTAVALRQKIIESVLMKPEYDGIVPHRFLMMFSLDAEHQFITTRSTQEQYIREVDKCIEICGERGLDLIITIAHI